MRETHDTAIGIVGCGEVAHQHLSAWRRVRRARIAAVCDSSEARARETAGAWKVPSYYSGLDEMLASERLTIVDVCVPPQAHCPVIGRAVQAGCHAIVEKPLAMSTEEVKTIAAHCEQSKRKLTVIHNWLYTPVMVGALSAIRGGVLGQVVSVEVQALAPPEDPMFGNSDHWCHSIPGGAFGEMLAHPIYIVQGIVGRATVVAVKAAKRGSYPWAAFDELQVMLDADGASALVCASFNAIRNDVLINVRGTKGMFSIDLLSNTLVHLRYRPLELFSKGADSLRQASQVTRSIARDALLKASGRWVGGLELSMQAFVASVLGEGEPLVSLDDAYHTVRLLEEVCQEIESQRATAATG